MPRDKVLIDSSVPSSARVWNYWAGGKDHYEIDRETGSAFERTVPRITVMARQAGAFRVRAVAHLAGECGVRQFLDLGAGLPNTGDTHETAQRIAPDTRIVYADHDPHVVTHINALCPSTPVGLVTCLKADVRDPQEILDEAGQYLDFDRPVALMLMNVLGHVPVSDEAAGIVHLLLKRLPGGSYLVHCDRVDTSPAHIRAQQDYNTTAAPYVLRRPADLSLFYAGLDPLDPGIGPVDLWRPAPDTVPYPTEIHGGAARIPS